MAFKLRQDDYQVQTRAALLDNTLTVEVGDVIIPTNSLAGVVTNATATLQASLYILGVVTGFCYKNLQVIGQGQDPLTTPNQYTTAASNTSLGALAVYATYIPVEPEMEFTATLSATAGVTTGSDQPFTWFTLTDARTVAEATVVAPFAGTAPLSVFSYGIAPEDVTNHSLIVRFAKCINYQP